MQDDGSIVVALLLIAVVIAIYCVPMYVALARKHPQANAIAVLNLLLGWTFIGWVASLVWALTNQQRPQSG